MSRLVTALERDGLAVRERHADDGRAVVVAASPKGRAILRRGRELRIGELAALLDDLAPSDLETLAEASRIVEDVSALRHPPAVRMLAIPRKGGGPT